MSELDRLRKNVFDNLQEIERLNNIIKEVRKYIKNHREAVDERLGHIIYILKDDFDEEDILKILDKGSDKEWMKKKNKLWIKWSIAI